MARETVTVTVPEQARDRIQRLQYETEARKDLLKYLADSGSDPEGDAYRTCWEQFRDLYVQLQQEKEQLEREILRPAAAPGRLVSWNLDFASRECACVREV